MRRPAETDTGFEDKILTAINQAYWSALALQDGPEYVRDYAKSVLERWLNPDLPVDNAPEL